MQIKEEKEEKIRYLNQKVASKITLLRKNIILLLFIRLKYSNIQTANVLIWNEIPIWWQFNQLTEFILLFINSFYGKCVELSKEKVSHFIWFGFAFFFIQKIIPTVEVSIYAFRIFMENSYFIIIFPTKFQIHPSQIDTLNNWEKREA